MNTSSLDTAQAVEPNIDQHIDQSKMQRYCYHCRRYHDPSEMRRVATRIGARWRCRASIEAARQDASAREAYGRQTTATNRADCQRRIDFINQHRRRDEIT